MRSPFVPPPHHAVTPATQATSKPVLKGRRPPQAIPAPQAPVEPASTARRFPTIPFALTLLLFALILVPPVSANPWLAWSFAGVGAALLIWEMALWALAARGAREFRFEFVPVRSHYVQACVQFAIMVWWGWHAREVYAEFPLILAQVIYLYAFEGLITWSRGRVWRLGFGPLPIILSTNLLLWFKHDWYVFQFLMLTAGALGKQFLTWERDGRRTHIFNPSAFGQFLFAIALIATGMTSQLTWGERLAATFDPPYMLVVIFLGGLVVQYLFHVTLMTVAAVAVLVGLNLLYTEVTGVYYFVNTNLAATIFLGIHLLVTDPATSPRTNLGRAIFGGLYGAAYFALFRVLDNMGVPLFWDKLLPVPILNLCVPLIDRIARAGPAGGLNRLWETALRPARLNLVHMGCWGALFGAMIATGYSWPPHPGNSIPFWKRAVAEGKPRAAESLVIAAQVQMERGSGDAANELGLMCVEGSMPGSGPDPARAARYFARACALGSPNGCANLADQFLFLHGLQPGPEVTLALDRLEQACGNHPDSNMCFRIGYAYEVGRGRPLDPRRAVEFYERCGPANPFAAKGLARIGLSGAPYDLTHVAPVLARLAGSGDDEACWYLAYMHLDGNGVARDTQKARELLTKACSLGLGDACEALKQAEIPAFARPILLTPAWSKVFP